MDDQTMPSGSLFRTLPVLNFPPTDRQRPRLRQAQEHATRRPVGLEHSQITVTPRTLHGVRSDCSHRVQAHKVLEHGPGSDLPTEGPTALWKPGPQASVLQHKAARIVLSIAFVNQKLSKPDSL